MRKILISTLVASSLFANVDLVKEVELLKTQVAELQKTLKKANLTSMKKQIAETKALANGDNLRFDVDFRSSLDSVRYKRVSGKVDKNSNLISNRMWLGMQYAPRKDIVFKGSLAYNKAFGDMTTKSATAGYSDWVSGEALSDNSIKLRQAYFLYLGKSFLGSDIPWTASIGRRPATLGYPLHFRENEKAQSPVSHIVNMELDGASFKFKLDKGSGIDGMYIKFCIARALTNAKPRFDFEGLDYSKDKNFNPEMDLGGIIFQAYDNGQYKVVGLAGVAKNVVGLSDTMEFNDVGDLYLGGLTFMVSGIGDMISDFLDDTTLFASIAYSKTSPANGKEIFGSERGENGYSYYLGAQFPALISSKSKIGLEYNHGSKYFKGLTYGEDTMIGSKVATRGDAYEVYFTQPLIGKILDMQLRYTFIDYEYTGSSAFFGNGGTPYSIKEAKELGFDPVEEAQDLRLYFRYRY